MITSQLSFILYFIFQHHDKFDLINRFHTIAADFVQLISALSYQCQFLLLLDLHYGNWGIVPMVLLSQTYGILEPTQEVHKQHVSCRRHNGAKIN